MKTIANSIIGEEHTKQTTNQTDLEIPYYGKGSLVVLFSWADDYTHNKNILLINHEGSTYKIRMNGLSDVRWASKNRILASQTSQNKSRIIIFNNEGKVLDDFGSGLVLSDLAPNHRGDKVALVEYRIGKGSFLQVRDLNSEFNILNQFSLPPPQQISNLVWKDDNLSLAAGVWTSDKTGRLWPILTIFNSQLKDVKYPMGNTYEKQSEPAGIKPLFWDNHIIYGRSDRGLLKCDPQTGKPELVYSPGDHRLIMSGVLVENHKALLLVRDLKLDPLEIRAKEVHEVDLSTYKGSILTRAPENVYISSIDWIN